MRMLLTARNFLLLGAIALGLLLGDRVAPLDPYAIPILMVIMTVSMSGVAWGRFRDPRDILRPAAAGIVLNHLVLGGATLVLGWAFTGDPELRAGFLLVAAAPPGIAIIPFARILAGDAALATAGVVAGFASTLAVAPLAAALFLGNGLITPSHLFPALVKLLVVPFVAAQLIIRAGLAPRVARWHGAAVNWGFAVIVLAAVGVNRGVFLGSPGVLLRCGAAALASVFGLGWLLNAVFSRAGVDREKRASLVLLGTVKNSAFSTAIGIVLLGKTASVPGVVVTVVIILFLIAAPRWLGRQGAPGAPIDTRGGMV
jgi:BASS family bile acid:Na+ symporter